MDYGYSGIVLLIVIAVILVLGAVISWICFKCINDTSNDGGNEDIVIRISLDRPPSYDSAQSNVYTIKIPPRDEISTNVSPPTYMEAVNNDRIETQKFLGPLGPPVSALYDTHSQ